MEEMRRKRLAAGKWGEVNLGVSGGRRVVVRGRTRVLTQDSVERVSHVHRVELGGREGTAHRSVSWEM